MRELLSPTFLSSLCRFVVLLVAILFASVSVGNELRPDLRTVRLLRRSGSQCSRHCDGATNASRSVVTDEEGTP
jgi:hypothetical protein